MKKAILFFTAILSFGTAKAQTTCTEPGPNQGNTGCITFTYNGETVQYTTVRAKDGKVWMQQNLGSSHVATSATDAEAYGDLFQWGRWADGHEKRTSATSAALPNPNNPSGLQTTAFLTANPGWWSVGAAGESWSAATPADASDISGCDPCKAALGNGWRVPTEAEWTSIIESEGLTDIATAYSSNLKLTVAGNRSGTNGTFVSVGQRGYYWSGTQSGTTTNYGKYLFYSNLTMNAGAGAPRSQGSSVRCVLGDPVAPQPIQPTSLNLTVQNDAPATITTNGGTLQLVTEVLPATAGQGIVWNILSGNENITFSSSGLVTAVSNGSVTIQAVSAVNGNIFDTINITITNQVAAPASIAISAAGNATEINVNQGTLQLSTAVLPANAYQSVTWSITQGAEVASVNENGLVTAIANGTVIVQAASTVNNTITSTINIAVTNQVIMPQSIEIKYAEDDSAIFYKDGTIQLFAEVIPAEASQEVTWSIIEGAEFATIDESGLVTGIDDGIATVQATSTVDGTILETIEVTVKNQNLESAEPYCQAAVQYGVEPITKVVFAGISNESDAAVDQTPGYENFLSVSGNAIKGQTYTLAVQGNTAGLFEHDIRVFIDWNQNNAFDMETEYYATSIADSDGTDGTEATIEITVPEDALTGTTRLRITKDMWNVYEEGEFDACTNAYYGQVEDYSLNVTNVAGLNDVNAVQFSLYPNPTNSSVTIQSNQNIQLAEVFNLTGQLIAQGTTQQLNLNAAQAGVYIVKVHFENGATATQKVIKK